MYMCVFVANIFVVCMSVNVLYAQQSVCVTVNNVSLCMRVCMPVSLEHLYVCMIPVSVYTSILVYYIYALCDFI